MQRFKIIPIQCLLTDNKLLVLPYLLEMVVDWNDSKFLCKCKDTGNKRMLQQCHYYRK